MVLLLLSAFVYFPFSPNPLQRGSCDPLMGRKKPPKCHSPPGGEDDELKGARLKAERPAGEVAPEPRRQMVVAFSSIRGKAGRGEGEDETLLGDNNGRTCGCLQECPQL